MIHMQDLLRKIPKVDLLIEAGNRAGLNGRFGTSLIRSSAQDVLSSLRGQILEGSCNSIPETDELVAEMAKRCGEKSLKSLRPVINATGVILHTNLGRSVLSGAAADAVYEAATHYSTVEYDISRGVRGSRHSHVEQLLTALCGCEAGMVVNNNAAAVLLMLTGLAAEKEVVVSRGELVEIGGSFRMPDIMEMSGALLREIGTTNKTRASDYEKAINENTAAVLKVHTSNFVITGFTESVPIREISEIAHRNGLPSLYDLGSGLLFPIQIAGSGTEPNARDALKAGADLVCFSGDKLLGGPQAGIIVGRKEYIDRLKAHPLMRALRCDKMTLAALEATLRIYREPERIYREIPTQRMLHETQEALLEKAEDLCRLLRKIGGVRAEIVEDISMAGGGSLPGREFPTACVAVAVDGMSADATEQSLRSAAVPVVARIKNGRCLLDMRTVDAEELALLTECIQSAVSRRQRNRDDVD